MVAYEVPAYQLQQDLWHVVNASRQSQLEVQKNLSLLSCKIFFFAFMEIVFLSVSMLLLLQLCFLSFHTGL